MSNNNSRNAIWALLAAAGEVACCFFAFLLLMFALPANAQTTSPAQWQQNSWQRNCASLDMDFYNDRYYINHNTTCDGTTGTFYTAGSGNTGVQNFITGTGATFTRAGTNNVTATSSPFYLNTTLDSFVSRASVTNNVTSTFAPFYIGTTGNGPSESWVSRASLGTYFTFTGNLVTAASGTARINAYYYNGSTLTSGGGTLIEPAATNYAINTGWSGASAGTPGTMPTGWQNNTGTGVTEQVVGTGIEYGMSYIDLNYSGTSGSSTVYPGPGMQGTTYGVPASPFQTWTSTIYARVTAGTMPGQFQNYIFEYSPSLVYLGGNLTSVALGTNLTKVTETLTTVQGTGYVTPTYRIAWPANTTGNVTIRFYAPQIEQGSVSTSYIANTSTTAGATATRAADVYSQQPASYFDSSGTLWFSAANIARTNYYNSGGSWVLGGTVIEPAATNSTTNNMMVGAVPADGIERTNNGTFSTTSPNVCSGSVTSGSNTLSCNNGTGAGWVGSINSGTGTVTATSGNMTLTGDGTNAASIYEAITTVSGYAYTIAVTVGSGSSVTVQAGTTVGGTNLSTAKTANAGTTTSFQFTATGSTTYIQVNNTSATSATLTAVSMQSAGQLPTGWNLSGSPFAYNGGIVITLVNSGTASGISFFDLQFKGTPAATSFINLQSGLITATNGQTWDDSSFLAIVGGSTANILRLTMNTAVYASGSSYLSELFSAVSYTSASSTMTRYSSTGTISNSSAASIGPYYQLSYTNGLPVNITVRIGMPQMEQSSYSTSAIPTFGSAVTRTADVYSVPNGGTYFNGSGVLTQAGVNVPRLDHNPVSPYLPMGILMENNETNYITYSVPDGGANWSYAAYNTVGTANATTAPDGTTTAASIADNSTSGVHSATPTAAISVTSGTTYNFSVFVKPSTATDVQLDLPSPPFPNALGGAATYANFNLTTGAVVTGSTSSATIQALSNGWYRCSLYSTASSTSTVNPLVTLTNNSTSGAAEPSYSGSGEMLYIWGAQFEATQGPTSYIPTAGSSVARAQDIFTVPGTAGGGSGWLTNNIGTLSTVGSILYQSGSMQAFAGLDDGTTANSLYTGINVNQNRTAITYSSGSNQYVGILSPNTSYTLGNTTKIAFGFSTGFEGAAADNVGMADGSSALPATQSRLVVGAGRNTLYPPNGWIQRLWYMPTLQPDAALINYTQ